MLGTVEKGRCGGGGAAPGNTDGHHIPAPTATSHLTTPGNTVTDITLPSHSFKAKTSTTHTLGTAATLTADHNTWERQ